MHLKLLSQKTDFYGVNFDFLLSLKSCGQFCYVFSLIELFRAINYFKKLNLNVFYYFKIYLSLSNAKYSIKTLQIIKFRLKMIFWKYINPEEVNIMVFNPSECT